MQSEGKNNRQIVVYDESGPDLLYPRHIYGPHKDEETPLQRPRPPEETNPVKERYRHCLAVSLLSGLITLIGLSALILLLVMHLGKSDSSPPSRAFRSSPMTDHTTRLQMLEKENEQMKELSKSLQSQLSVMKKRRKKSLTLLNCARSRLRHLRPDLLADLENICGWDLEDSDEIFLSDESVKQSKKGKNRTSLSPEFASRYKIMEDQFESHLSHQSKFCSQVRDSISSSLYERNTQKGLVSEALTRANEKMIQVIASMERAASQEVYKEQDWINAQMKSARNKADLHQNTLQLYLTEKILPQLRIVEASLLDQRHVLQGVTSEIDDLLKNQLAKWEGFIVDQKDLNAGLFKFLEETESSRKKHLQKLGEKETQRKKAESHLRGEFAALLSQVESFSQKLSSHSSRSNKSADESMSIIRMIRSEDAEMYKSLEGFTESSVQSTKAMVYEGSQKSALIKAKQKYVMDCMDKSFEAIVPASEAISLQSKEFVSRFQDDSNKRYTNFERELRKKSELSSEYLKIFNHDTQDVRSLTLSSQKHLESMLESQQDEDAKVTNQLQTDIEGQCKALKTFGDSYGKKLIELGYSTNQKILEDLRQQGDEGPA